MKLRKELDKPAKKYNEDKSERYSNKSSIKMRTLAAAMTLGTPHEGKLTDAHIWKTTRHRHPEYIKPAQAVDNEDRRVDWLTYRNIMLWMKMAKKFLLAVEMAKDEPGHIRKWHYLTRTMRSSMQPWAASLLLPSTPRPVFLSWL